MSSQISSVPTSLASSFFSASSTTSFADVAHQTLLFDREEAPSRLVLALLDTAWMQRLRRIKQTGNTHQVYMFAEHSRFGHSLGVAFLAIRLMQHLKRFSRELIEPFECAVAAAAILHDVGHVAPGSHLAERIWGRAEQAGKHEEVSVRILREDPEIRGVLEGTDSRLTNLVAKILADDLELPHWTKAIISGGGWNADRGNWAIVDSAMCSVTYGRYNVFALIDAFRLTTDGELVLQESRLDALTHFFVARDSMYRQVYQHRVLQAVDALTEKVAERVTELGAGRGCFADETLQAVLDAPDYARTLPLSSLFSMDEHWWGYHIGQWCRAEDRVLSDLAQRIRDRRLLKTVRIDSPIDPLISRAKTAAKEAGFDPRYYVLTVRNTDTHRGGEEEPPRVLLDNGKLARVTEIEPLIGTLLAKPETPRTWLAVPAEVKRALGRTR